MAPGKGLLRSKEPTTGPSDVTNIGDPERKNLMADRSENDKQGSTGDRAQHRIPREGFGDSAVMK